MRFLLSKHLSILSQVPLLLRETPLESEAKRRTMLFYTCASTRVDLLQ